MSRNLDSKQAMADKFSKLFRSFKKINFKKRPKEDVSAEEAKSVRSASVDSPNVSYEVLKQGIIKETEENPSGPPAVPKRTKNKRKQEEKNVEESLGKTENIDEEEKTETYLNTQGTIGEKLIDIENDQLADNSREQQQLQLNNCLDENISKSEEQQIQVSNAQNEQNKLTKNNTLENDNQCGKEEVQCTNQILNVEPLQVQEVPSLKFNFLEERLNDLTEVLDFPWPPSEEDLSQSGSRILNDTEDKESTVNPNLNEEENKCATKVVNENLKDASNKKFEDANHSNQGTNLDKNMAVVQQMEEDQKVISSSIEEDKLIQEATESFKEIQSVIEGIEKLVANFSGTVTDSEEYYYLDETMTNCMIKLDNVSSKNIQIIRDERRKIIKYVQTVMKMLDQKIKENRNKASDKVQHTDNQ